jgi:hypothetical protein
MPAQPSSERKRGYKFDKKREIGLNISVRQI